MLELEKITVEDKVSLTGEQQAHLFLATIRKYCQSKLDDISLEHVPESKRLLGLLDGTKAGVQNWIAQQSSAIWERMLNPSDGIPMGHDGYLKVLRRRLSGRS